MKRDLLQPKRSQRATNDDLRALFAQVNSAFDRIDQAIREASFFRIFWLKVKFFKDVAPLLGPYKFKMECEGDTWTVGFVPKRGRRAKEIIVEAAKVDEAVNTLMDIFTQVWGKEREAGRRAPEALPAAKTSLSDTQK